MSLSARDKALLDGAASGKSANELEALTGLPAARCLTRVQEMLDARDIWSETQRRQLLIHDLMNLKDALQERIGTDLDPKMVTGLVNTFRTISDVLDRSSKITDAQLDRVSIAQGKALMTLIMAAFGRAKELLAEEYPDVNIIEIEDAFNEGLRESVKEIHA